MKIHKKDNKKAAGGGGGDDEEDETLECRDCSSEFVFTAGEKKFYKEKGKISTFVIARAPNFHVNFCFCFI
jgi:hypothetical protein